VRRALILAAVLATIAGIGVVVAGSSPNLAKCTRVGTADSDPLRGTDGRDVICALQGTDFISGRAGADKLFGDVGRDTIVGGKGPDILKGGKGRDRLFTVDGVGNDQSNGGAGVDFCYADPGDVARKCEHIFRRATLATANALAQAFDGSVNLGEELLSVTPTLTIPGPTSAVTVTVTVTKVAPFPACDPPPNIPPAPC